MRYAARQHPALEDFVETERNSAWLHRLRTNCALAWLFSLLILSLNTGREAWKRDTSHAAIESPYSRKDCEYDPDECRDNVSSVNAWNHEGGQATTSAWYLCLTDAGSDPRASPANSSSRSSLTLRWKRPNSISSSLGRRTRSASRPDRGDSLSSPCTSSTGKAPADRVDELKEIAT
jgi:hypothetical protein